MKRLFFPISPFFFFNSSSFSSFSLRSYIWRLTCSYILIIFSFSYLKLSNVKNYYLYSLYSNYYRLILSISILSTSFSFFNSISYSLRWMFSSLSISLIKWRLCFYFSSFCFLVWALYILVSVSMNLFYRVLFFIYSNSSFLTMT